MELIVRVQVKDNGRFAIEFAKEEGGDSFYVIKANKIVTGSNGRFISGPSFKPEDGDWVNYTYADKAFQEYVMGLVDAAVPSSTGTNGSGNGTQGSDSGQREEPPFNPDDEIPF